MFANMFSGKDSAKMHWADILPFQVPGLETTERVMPASTEKALIKLAGAEQLPRWAYDLALRIPTIREAIEK